VPFSIQIVEFGAKAGDTATFPRLDIFVEPAHNIVAGMKV
jgi:hypothetical protein